MFLFFLNNFWIIFGNFGLISKSVRVINPPDGGPGVDNCNRHPL